MSTNRRQFIKATAAGAVAASLPLGASADGHEAEQRPLDILVLGGTGFIGKELITELLARRGKGTIYVLVRRGSKGKFNELKKAAGDQGENVGRSGRKIGHQANMVGGT